MQEFGTRAATGVEALTQALAALENRVTALEMRAVEGATAVQARVMPADSEASSMAVPTSLAPPARMPALGRAMLVLAGAFLLRALTDAQTVAPAIGLALGMGYGLLVVHFTYREASAGRRGSASLMGLASVLVAYPFLWETTTQLHLLPPAGAAVFLAVITALGLLTAARHGLPGLAWAFAGGALATATGLAWATPLSAVYAGLVVAVATATVWLGYSRGWWGLRWPAAALANGLVLLLVSLAIRSGPPLAGRPQPSAEAMLLLSVALPAAYLGSFFLRALAGHHEVGVFEILQTLGCTLTGVFGAVLVLKANAIATAGLGGPLLLVAAASYAVAFAHVRRREGRSLNFFYFAWLGLALALLGTALTLPAPARPPAWAVLGAAMALAGGLFDRWTLRLHGAVYLTTAAAFVGIGAAAFDAFVTRDPGGWHRLGLAGTTVWLLATVGYSMLVVSQRRHQQTGWQRLPRGIVAALVVIGAGSLLVNAIVAGLGAQISGPPAAILAAVRTTVLAIAAVAIAAGSRNAHLSELGWFVNPLLVLAGLKLLAEDLRRGTPASLFLGFGCFGVALIAAPRLRRKDRT
jgi:hypothetical protein